MAPPRDYVDPDEQQLLLVAAACEQTWELGARIGDTDLWCATPDAADFVDPVRELPSPSLA